jgi:hypothetical protein
MYRYIKKNRILLQYTTTYITSMVLVNFEVIH